MALWFWRGLRRGVVTTRYPDAIDAWTSELPTPPRFDPRRLTQDIAYRLVEICPSEALRRDGAILLFDVGACTGCGRCAAAAGGATRPSGLFELAALARHHLVKSIPIGGDNDKR